MRNIGESKARERDSQMLLRERSRAAAAAAPAAAARSASGASRLVAGAATHYTTPASNRSFSSLLFVVLTHPQNILLTDYYLLRQPLILKKK